MHILVVALYDRVVFDDPLRQIRECMEGSMGSSNSKHRTDTHSKEVTNQEGVAFL